MQVSSCPANLCCLRRPTYRPDLLLQALGILLGPLIVQLKHPRLLLVAGCLQGLTNVVQATSGTTKLIFDEISA